MGFYGNITNTSKTTFQFDKIYPNRNEMDKNASSDGIYIGRYVLIEYDKKINPLNYTVVYKRNVPIPNNKNNYVFGLSLNAAGEIANRIFIGDGENGLPNNSVVRVPGATKDGSKNYYNQTYKEITLTNDKYEANKYYIYDEESSLFKLATSVEFNVEETYYSVTYGTVDEYYKVYGSEGQEANFSRILGDQEGKDATNYVWNYNIDISIYGASRGYDSTVWQKTVSNGHDKYVMIAELNSVVPTFDVCADAPTIVPLSPHFDTTSTNVYYKLHWQPSWGLRVKSADTDLRGPILNANGGIDGGFTLLTNESKDYPSDVNTSWLKNEYDPATDVMYQYYFDYDAENHSGQWGDLAASAGKDTNTVPAAIYFNKAGFDPEIVTYSNDKQYEGWSNKTVKDTISITPTGISGHQYNLHKGTTEVGAKSDTQELEMMLPSLGDSIAKIWDIVYGGRDTNEGIKETNKRNLDIKWEDASAILNRQGLRMVKDKDEKYAYNDDKGDNKYNKASVNTLAGCINSVHDLMGMIITPRQGIDNLGNIEGLDDNLIYYDTLGGKYYRKHLTYDYEEIPFTADNYTMEAVEVDEANYAPGLYYISSATGSSVVPENCTISNDRYDSSKIYYKKKFGKDQEKTTPIDISNLLDFSKGEYWYSDTDGDSKVGNELAKMNFIKDSIYHKGKNYYQIQSGPKSDLINDYKENTLFYYTESDLDENETGYKLDTNKEFTPDRKYVKLKNIRTIKESSNEYDGIYLPNTFYYKAIEDENRTPFDLLSKEEQERREETKDYVYILDTTETGKGIITNTIQIMHYAITKTIVHDGQIYKLVDEYKATKDYTRDSYDSERSNYYILTTEGKYIPAKNIYPTYASLPANIVLFELLQVYKKTDEAFSINETPLFLMTYDSKNPVYIRKPVNPNDKTSTLYNYINLTEANIDPTCKTDYYQFEKENVSVFYEPYRYHYKVIDESNPYFGSYLLDRQKNMERDPEKTDFYYELGKKGKIIKVTKDFFEPNKYYDIDGNLIETKPIDTNTVYEKRDLFVIEDSNNIYQKGAKWSHDVKSIPASVKIGTREERYEVVPIEELAQSLNTIHGLILEINKILERDDSLTRDNTTVQGTLNELNDIIAKFDKLNPSEIVVVDSYGRIHSAPISFAQKATAQLQKDKSNGIKGDTFAEVATLDEMNDQWLTLYINDNPSKPQITIRHNFQPVKNTISSSDKNNSITPNQIDLYTPIVDKMGHVVGKNTETVTLPYGFKTIKTNGRSTSVDINTGNAVTKDVIADNTQDILSINSGNKWIKIDTDEASDILTLSHGVYNFNAGEANTDYGLLNTKSIKNLDSDNTFIIPYFAFDEAGHIIKAGNNTVTIPEVFNNIKVITNDTLNNDSLVGSAGTAVADSLEDTLNLIEGNRWINITVNEDSDSITLSHYAKGFVESTGALDYNNTKEKTFDIQSITWDRAGHVTSSVKNTFTLPDGFSSVKIVNDNLNQITDSTAANGTINASSLKDLFILGNGNRWIKLVASNKQINIVHAMPDTNAENLISTLAEDQTPTFNEKFNIPVIKYDKAGHISDISTAAITIPNITLTNGTGNVVTGISYSNGNFTETKANIGTLLLNGYINIENGKISATDSLNQALHNIDSALVNEISNREKAINDLDFNTVSAITGKIISSISQTNGLINVETRNLIADDITPLLGTMAQEDRNNYQTISDFNSFKQNLTYRFDLSTGNIISSVNQSNGKISIEQRPITADDIPILSEYITNTDLEGKKYLSKDELFTYGEEKITVSALLNKISELNQRITELENNSTV